MILNVKHQTYLFSNINKFILLILVNVIVNTSLGWQNNELISNLHSKIEINSDSSLTVTETITVNAQHQKIKRGITRAFPTNYYDKAGNNVNIGFSVIKTLLDGQPCSHFLTAAPNGIIVNFGNDHFISKGMHTYTITYQTNRQLMFKDNWTELYFNIIGNNVIFPVLEASAEIHLPLDIPTKQIELYAYTGYFSSKDQDYQAWIKPPNVCHFKTTKTLQPKQSFTISVAFPNSTNITQPSLLTKIKWFIKDNLYLAILFLIAILLLIIYSLAYYEIHKNKPIITPLFSPPSELLPADCARIYHKKFNNTALTATIVDMAVTGYLQINYTPGSFTKKETYVLKKTNSSPKTSNLKYDNLAEIWFKDDKTASLNQSNYKIIDKIINRLKFVTNSCANYIAETNNALVLGFVMSFCAIFSFFISAFAGTFLKNSGLILILIFIIILINIIFYHLLKDYTPAGQKVYAQIAGFKMYLEYAEKDRIAKLNPPNMTIELFEKYLPYAIALDVDQAWTNSFHNLYLKIAAHAYHPHWLFRPNFHPQHLNSDLHNLSQHINSTLITTPSYAPGSVSGRGGGGFSGGGGGGGGIGGR